LTDLSLTSNEITDVGLTALTSIKSLNKLNLYSEKVTNLGMKEISKHTNLTHLTLVCKLISDDGFLELVALKKLRVLSVSSSKITEVGMQKFRESIPKCETYLSK
jgi:hypothetical protein